MNLLTDAWLPVRKIEGGTINWISLSDLLTGQGQYEICLPRDDLEMAALQLVICIIQVLFTPKDLRELLGNLRAPMSEQKYLEGIKDYKEWFSVDHPEYPFMQVRGVKANLETPMAKLMAGLTGATSSCFVNEPGQADRLCAGCAAIALFNQAANAPSFGGGFKAGLRGSAPITTLIQGRHLRETVWLNILDSMHLEATIPGCYDNWHQPPTWVQSIEEKSSIQTSSIGLLRGLLWQPANIELCSPASQGDCCCCGRKKVPVYEVFLKAKFNYTLNGLWPYPHSPRMLNFKNNTSEEKFASFTTSAPTWTRLAGFVVQKEVNQNQKEGHQPAAVVLQARKLFSKQPARMRLAVGGYRNNQASVIERRHEHFDLNKGWHQHPNLINEFVELGLGHKSALRKSLYVFYKGMKEVKGAGVAVQELGEVQFYRRTDSLMQKTLAEANFYDPEQLAHDKDILRSALKQHCLQIFQEQVSPYLHDPELIRTMAVARRTLNKHLDDLKPESKGGE